jgi:multiple sugar transport system permease protein
MAEQVAARPGASGGWFSEVFLSLRERRAALVLLGPCVLYLIVFSVFPLIYSLRVAFSRYDPQAGTYTWIGLENFRSLFTSPTFWQITENTAIFTFVGVGIQTVLGVGLALFFNQRLRGAAVVRALMMLPMMLTPVVVGLMWRALLNPDWGMLTWLAQRLGFGHVNWIGDESTALWTLLAVDIWQWTPFVFIVVFARLQSLPTDVFEAAAVDGAGWFTTTRQVTLPLLSSAIIFAAIFRGIDAFRSFELVYGLTYGGPGQAATSTYAFEAFRSGFSFFRYGYAAAISYLMVVIATIALAFLFKAIKLTRQEVS